MSRRGVCLATGLPVEWDGGMGHNSVGASDWYVQDVVLKGGGRQMMGVAEHWATANLQAVSVSVAPRHPWGAQVKRVHYLYLRRISSMEWASGWLEGGGRNWGQV